MNYSAEKRNNIYPLVSVIFITYNRLEQLKNTLYTFISKCNYPNLELIICDDGSFSNIQEEIRKMKFDVFLLADKNQGLGRNTNKGLEAANGEFILQLQDDWDFIGNPSFIESSISYMQNNPEVGIIRYYKGGETFAVNTNKLNYIAIGHKTGINGYSDTPHLKKRQVHEKLGYYLEDVTMIKMELDFLERWNKNSIFKSVLYEMDDLFIHTGAEHSFNPFQLRQQRIEKLKQNHIYKPFIAFYLFSRKMAKIFRNKINENIPES